MIDLPKNWRPGDDIRDNEHHDSVVRAIQRLAGEDCTGDVAQRSRFAPILARVTTAGPKGEANYTDARYWVRIATIDGGTETDAMAFTQRADAGKDDPPVIFTATNLSEFLAASHSLANNSPVWCFPIYDSGENTVKRWLFYTPRPGNVLVKITGSASGGGKYTGNIWNAPTANIPATGDLTEAELGLDSSTTVRVVNSREVGASTHDLASSAFLPLIFPATFLRVADDGVAVYMVDGLQQKDCSS